MSLLALTLVRLIRPFHVPSLIALAPGKLLVRRHALDTVHRRTAAFFTTDAYKGWRSIQVPSPPVNPSIVAAPAHPGRLRGVPGPARPPTNSHPHPLQAYTGTWGYCGKPSSAARPRRSRHLLLWTRSGTRPPPAHGAGGGSSPSPSERPLTDPVAGRWPSFALARSPSRPILQPRLPDPTPTRRRPGASSAPLSASRPQTGPLSASDPG